MEEYRPGCYLSGLREPVHGDKGIRTAEEVLQQGLCKQGTNKNMEVNNDVRNSE